MSTSTPSWFFDNLLSIPVLITNGLCPLLWDKDVIHLLQTKRGVRDVLRTKPYVLKRGLDMSYVCKLTVQQTSGLIRIGRIGFKWDTRRNMFRPAPNVTSFHRTAPDAATLTAAPLHQLFANINVDSLHTLDLAHGFSQPLIAAELPPSITTLLMTEAIQQTLTSASLPPTLTDLTIHGELSSAQSFALPESLIRLSVATWPATKPLVLPSSLRSLICLVSIDADIAPHSLPSSLTELSGLRRITPNVFPAALTKLTFGNSFNEPLTVGLLPDSITELHLTGEFNQPLLPGVLPRQLHYLYINGNFNHPLQIGVLPLHLQVLQFIDPSAVTRGHSLFNQPLSPGVLPSELEQLIFGHDFNQPLTPNILPKSLIRLRFGTNFQQPINIKILPPNLKFLWFENSYRQRITTDLLPRSVKFVHMNNQDIPRSIIWTLMD